MKDRLYLFDTTLRDGQQTPGIDFSVEDKIAIARLLDAFGIDYVEGGYPGANPTDTELFAAPHAFDKAVFTAFGMTRRPGRRVMPKAVNLPLCGRLVANNSVSVALAPG